MIEMTLENAGVAAIVAVVISLLLEWFPGLKKGWWDQFAEAQKRGLMAVAGINCAAYQVCPADWLTFVRDVFLVFIAAAAGQQGVYALAKNRRAE